MTREEIIRGLQERFRQRRHELNERERRHWAGREAMALGRGGITMVSQALRMSPNTIKRGMRELCAADPEAGHETHARVRMSGGGRKSNPPSAGSR